MENKGFIKDTLIAILSIIFGLLICIYIAIAFGFFTMEFLKHLFNYYRVIIIFLSGLSGFIFGILLMKSKNWARKIFLILTVIWLFFGLPLTVYYYLSLGIKQEEV